MVALAAGWWAGSATLGTAADPTAGPAAEPIAAEVVESSVGDLLEVSASVRQPTAVIAANHLPGVVTWAPSGSVQVDQGGVIYEVAAVPVRAVEGDRPFWRDLAVGARGPDVAQLERALDDIGLLPGRPDDRYTAATADAVRRWSDEAGVEPTGVVRLGEVVAVPVLPAPLAVGETVRPGALLSAGEDAVLAPVGEQVVELVLSAEQAGTVPADAAVRLSPRDGEGDAVWDAVVTARRQDERGTVLELRGPDGGPACAGSCGEPPAGGSLTLSAQVVLVPEVTGPSVPAAAVRSRADGSTYVLLAGGEERDVRVLASGRGVAVVDGIADGERVLLPVEQPAGPSAGD